MNSNKIILVLLALSMSACAHQKKMDLMLAAHDYARKILGKNPEVMRALLRDLDTKYPN